MSETGFHGNILVDTAITLPNLSASFSVDYFVVDCTEKKG